MSKLYMIYHVYDVDGGFGDSVTEEKLIGMTTDEKLAYAYVEKYDDCQPYAEPYDTLYCHALRVEEVENEELDINISPWAKDAHFNWLIAEYKERQKEEEEDEMNKVVIDAEFEMTGGGCYTYWGKFDNGTYFCFGLGSFAMYDQDYGITFTEEFYKETDGDTWEWEQEHMIGEVIYEPFPKEVKEYISQTIEILKKKYPESEELQRYNTEN